MTAAVGVWAISIAMAICVARPATAAETGRLTVSATPKEARVEIIDPGGRKQQPALPFEDKNAAAGTWKLTARAPDCADEVVEIEVQPGKTSNVTLELKPSGGVHLTATPEGTTFMLTGPGNYNKGGTAPWDATGLKAGSYHLSLSHSGYQTIERDVVVQAGPATAVNVTLLHGINTAGRATSSAPPPEEGGGTLSSAAVQDVIHSHQGEYQYCYEKELSNNPNLAGTVEVHFQVDPVGYVTEADIRESDLHNAGVESCLLSNVKRWKFSSPRGGKLADVNYPFVFNSD